MKLISIDSNQELQCKEGTILRLLKQEKDYNTKLNILVFEVLGEPLKGDDLPEVKLILNPPKEDKSDGVA